MTWPACIQHAACERIRMGFGTLEGCTYHSMAKSCFVFSAIGVRSF